MGNGTTRGHSHLVTIYFPRFTGNKCQFYDSRLRCAVSMPEGKCPHDGDVLEEETDGIRPSLDELFDASIIHIIKTLTALKAALGTPLL